MTFAQLLRQLRTRAKLTPAQLSARSGIPTASVFAYERGATSPSFRNVQRLAKALDVDFNRFSTCDLPEDHRTARRR